MQVDVKVRYEATQNELNKLNEEELGFVYATQTKYIPKIGYIHEMTFKQILEAKNFLNTHNSNPFDAEMKELGITDKEIESKNTDKFLGVKMTIWENDLKTRIEELRYEKRYANLVSDLAILHRNLEQEDLKAIDLASLSDEVVE